MTTMKNLEKDDEYSVEDKNTSLLKDTELFKVEDYIPHKVIRVKRVTKAKGTEDWNILEDSDVSLVLTGSRFNNKEKDFLRTPEGFKYIVDGFKKGWRSINKFKQNLTTK